MHWGFAAPAPDSTTDSTMPEACTPQDVHIRTLVRIYSGGGTTAILPVFDITFPPPPESQIPMAPYPYSASDKAYTGWSQQSLSPVPELYFYPQELPTPYPPPPGGYLAPAGITRNAPRDRRASLPSFSAFPPQPPPPPPPQPISYSGNPSGLSTRNRPALLPHPSPPPTQPMSYSSNPSGLSPRNRPALFTPPSSLAGMTRARLSRPPVFGTPMAAQPIVFGTMLGPDGRPLSNPSFALESPHPVEYHQKMFPTAEHLFHYMVHAGSLSPEMLERLRASKQLHREISYLPPLKGWTRERKQRMIREVLQLKFAQHDGLVEELLDTDNATLTDGRNTSDNVLGSELMRLREELGGRQRERRGIR